MSVTVHNVFDSLCRVDVGILAPSERLISNLESTEFADYVSGSWHVLRGGGAREWVDFEIRDVVFEDVAGHHLVLERVHFHVRLYDPAFGP